MTRIDSARAAADNARASVRHAAEAAAPYAETARETASQYAHEAGARLGPKVSATARQARCTARDGYESHVGPRLSKARGALPPEVDRTATRAARKTRRAARQATEYTVPRVESALAEARSAAGPARDEARQRSAAALAALRGEVSPDEIERLARQRARRARTGRLAKRLALLGLLAGGAYAAWRWWDKQANPDWLVEPPPATEVRDRGGLGAGESAAGTDPADASVLDPEVEAKQAESEAGRGDETR
ncbi:transcriptional regulator [Streptomyces armeniacus]|uniref:Transcriptional regulator n=1 Tax=Streptomyces armeniacus TaxID=83291 RepID=A0A345XPB1_9ACTN|nr:DUF5324 family protein [Streptomyces armeniacus]AXK33477.1 transcriptional regulator [Streptomyces armeniacus]